jgi:hypothetical protein
MNFAERFCAKRDVHPADYEMAVLRLTLHRRARLLRPLLSLNPNYFAADRAFIRAVGRISRVADFESEAEDYLHDPANRGFCHRTLRLRVSRRQMHRLVRDILKD